MRARRKPKELPHDFFTQPPHPATQRQIDLVYELADQLGVEPPEVLNRDSCRQFINNHIKRLATSKKRGGWS